MRSPGVVAILIFTATMTAQAHSMSESAVMLQFAGDDVRAELQLPLHRFSLAYEKTINEQNLTAERSSVTTYVLSRFHVRGVDGAAFHTRFDSPIAIKNIDGAVYVVADIHWKAPHDARSNHFEIEDDVILDSLPNQVALVSISSDWQASVFADDPQLVGVLHSADRLLRIDRLEGSWARGFVSVFQLGMRHIAEGTDHLLFILALLLPAPLITLGKRWAGPAPVSSSLARILKVVTAFTVGHSATLAVAALGLVRMPSRPIEVFIAVSILLSAVHAVRPIFPGKEAGIAAFFGLIHGLAFAKTLSDLGLGGWERVSGIFAFNLGIETMQLVVVVAAMPSLLILSRTPFYTPLRDGAAFIAGVAAVGWIAERLLNLETPVDTIIDRAAHHSMLICCLSTFVSVSLWWFAYSRQRRRGQHDLGSAWAAVRSR